MTTAILSRYGFGVADTRACYGDMPLPSAHQKLFFVSNPLTKIPHTIVTAAGALGLEQLCKPLRQPIDSLTPAHLQAAATPEATLEWLVDLQYQNRKDEDAFSRSVLLCNSRRQLILIDRAGGVSEIDEDTPFWVVGSGQPWALGYLQGIREFVSDDKIGVEYLKRAVQCASHYDTGTGPKSTSLVLT